MFWLAPQIIKYTLIFIWWLVKSTYQCIDNTGWWKSIAMMLTCIVVGYLIVSVLRPDVSENWRHDWRSFFRNAPRITVIIATPEAKSAVSPTPQAPTATHMPLARPVQPSSKPTPRATAATNLASNPTATNTFIPSPFPTTEPITTPVATPTSAPSGLTEPELADAREYALKLINQARTAVNLNEVVLGNNTAAQSHAEDLRANCVSGHWGTDGMKPYMRYTLAGGEQYSAENVSGIDFCPTDPDRYVANSITSEIDEAMNGLLSSPGHVRNILNPHHRKVNIGVSYRRPNLWLVQLFIGDYVEYSTQPKISEGRLTLRGRAKNGARIDAGRLKVTISWDQTPRPLTRGQLHHTGCVSGGTPIAAINPFGSFSAYEISGNRCADPYDVPIDASTATSYFDEPNLPLPTRFTHEVSLIATDQWHIDNDSFAIETDLSKLIDQHGDGVYTVDLWADIDGAEVQISEYSIFVDQLEIDGFLATPSATPALNPTAAPAPTTTPTRTPTEDPTVTPTRIPTYSPTVTPTPSDTPSPTFTAIPTATNTPSVTPTPVPITTSGLGESELNTAREYALKLINNARTTAGLNEVTFDDNTAAQSHAIDMRANCFLSHWGSDGLKPSMRYTLAGGQQYSAENISGIDFCPTDPDRYIANSTKIEIDEAMDGLLNSPGHLRNILNRHHRKVGIGISYQRPNLWLVQLFVGDYVEYESPPKIEAGQLTLSGKVKNGPSISGTALGVQIYYDQPPHQLTRGQLHHTTCGVNGAIIAGLRRPPGRNAHYSTHGYTQSGTRCTDPYEVPEDAPTASSYFDSKVHNTVPYQHHAVWITATEWSVFNDSFAISADITDLLNKQGDGVYTIVLWGEINGERTPTSEYSIFIPPYSPAP